MDHNASPQPAPQLPRYRRVELHAVPVSIQPRDRLLLKTIYEFPYSTAAQLSRLLPAGSINPQLRAYHDQRRMDAMFERVGGVRREIRRRLQQLFHAEGGPYVGPKPNTDSAGEPLIQRRPTPQRARWRVSWAGDG